MFVMYELGKYWMFIYFVLEKWDGNVEYLCLILMLFKCIRPVRLVHQYQSRKFKGESGTFFYPY